MSSIASALNPFDEAVNMELNDQCKPRMPHSAGSDLFIGRFQPIAWNPLTKQQTLDPNTDPMRSYAGYKTLAEKAVWEFANAHPHINVTASK
jgi:hypothetical protein